MSTEMKSFPLSVPPNSPRSSSSSLSSGSSRTFVSIDLADGVSGVDIDSQHRQEAQQYGFGTLSRAEVMFGRISTTIMFVGATILLHVFAIEFREICPVDRSSPANGHVDRITDICNAIPGIDTALPFLIFCALMQIPGITMMTPWPGPFPVPVSARESKGRFNSNNQLPESQRNSTDPQTSSSTNSPFQEIRSSWLQAALIPAFGLPLVNFFIAFGIRNNYLGKFWRQIAMIFTASILIIRWKFMEALWNEFDRSNDEESSQEV